MALRNERVRRLRSLARERRLRDAEGVVVVEGPTLVAEALRAGWELESQWLAPGADPVPGAGEEWRLADGVIEKVATTTTPQPVIAVARRPVRAATLLADVAARGGWIVVADAVADPGNLGTLMRSCEAAGADVIAVSGGADAWHPRVVRASAGAVFHIPVVRATAADAARAGFRVVGTSSHERAGARDYREADWSGAVALAVGNEAHGLGDEASAAVGEWVTIPHAGRAESLNVAMATTVLCFEIAGRRRRRGRDD
ncbi:MAG: TrmH family RNA methyltransferase [Acidimicrobiia bacterium]